MRSLFFFAQFSASACVSSPWRKLSLYCRHKFRIYIYINTANRWNSMRRLEMNANEYAERVAYTQTGRLREEKRKTTKTKRGSEKRSVYVIFSNLEKKWNRKKKRCSPMEKPVNYSFYCHFLLRYEMIFTNWRTLEMSACASFVAIHPNSQSARSTLVTFYNCVVVCLCHRGHRTR